MNTVPANATDRRNEIAHMLRRCSAPTIEAALRFQETRSPADVEPIIHGLIDREMPAENPTDLAAAPEDTRLIEDLGLDSLGLMDIVMAAEDVFGINIENEELRSIATMGELNRFIAEKVIRAD